MDDSKPVDELMADNNKEYQPRTIADPQYVSCDCCGAMVIENQFCNYCGAWPVSQ